MEISFLVFANTLGEFVSLMITNCNSKKLSPFYIFRIEVFCEGHTNLRKCESYQRQMREAKCLECVRLFGALLGGLFDK